MGRPKRINRNDSPAVAGKQVARRGTTVVDAVARVQDFHQLGLSAYSNRTIAGSDQEGDRFETWLDGIGLTLDALAAVAPVRTGQPVMSSTVLAAYIHARSQNMNAETSRQTLNFVVLFLRRRGWAVHELHGDSTSAKRLRGTIRSMHADRPAAPPKQAKALTLSDINVLVDTLDANELGWTPLTVAAMRTFVILGFATSMRGGEMVTTLRWNMVDVNQATFNLPGGRVFKHQDKAVRIPIPHNHTSGSCGDRCPVQVLRDWKATCDAAGIPTVDTLFLPPTRRTKRSQFIAGAEFDADPIARAVATKGDTPAVRRNAAKNLYSRMSSSWKLLCSAAGLSPDHQWQGVTSHGMRRGSATTAARAGVDEVLIAQRLRHADLATTSLYIDPELSDTTSLSFISDEQNAELAEVELVTRRVPHNRAD